MSFMLKLQRISLVICSVLVASPCSADVYRCPGPDGKPVYTDKRCEADTTPVLKSERRNDAPKADGEGVQTLKAFCADRWPADFQMQEHCLQQQATAITGLRPIVERWLEADGTEEQQILTMCAQRWKAGEGSFDWVMVQHCWEQQSAARERIR